MNVLAKEKPILQRVDLRNSLGIIHARNPTTVIGLNPEILFLERKDMCCFKTSPPVWDTPIHDTCNDASAIVATDSIAKGVFSTGHIV